MKIVLKHVRYSEYMPLKFTVTVDDQEVPFEIQFGHDALLQTQVYEINFPTLVALNQDQHVVEVKKPRVRKGASEPPL